MQAARPLAAIVLGTLLLLPACFGGELKPEGGGWYTAYRSHAPESGGEITLYRKDGTGRPVKIDERVYVARVYPNDCIVYEPGRDRGRLYVACGDRTPVSLVYAAPWDQNAQWVADDAGLHRSGPARNEGGRVVAAVERVPLAELERVALSNTPVTVERTVEPVGGNELDEHGRTALMRAVIAKELPVVDALLRSGANPNLADPYGSTALWHAVATVWPDTVLVRHLLDAGANPNVKDNTGMTLVMRAALQKEPELTRLLLARGASPCGRTDGGETIVDLAGTVMPELTALARAAYARCS